MRRRHDMGNRKEKVRERDIRMEGERREALRKIGR
jgi:hypothetical protein